MGKDWEWGRLPTLPQRHKQRLQRTSTGTGQLNNRSGKALSCESSILPPVAHRSTVHSQGDSSKIHWEFKHSQKNEGDQINVARNQKTEFSLGYSPEK